MLQWCFPGNNKVQTTFTPILMPDKNTRELRNNVNPTTKKLEISGFHGVFVLTKTLRKVGEKQSIMSLSMYDREISPSGSDFNQGLGKPRPWLIFRPLG